MTTESDNNTQEASSAALAGSVNSADIEQLKALGRTLSEVRWDSTNLANWGHAEDGLVLKRIEAALVELVEIVTRNLERNSQNQ